MYSQISHSKSGDAGQEPGPRQRDTRGLAFPTEGVPLPHTHSQTHPHLHWFEARARPAWTLGLHSAQREATSKAGHCQTARTKARLAAPGLAVPAASLRAWPAPQPARQQGWARTSSSHLSWSFQAILKSSYFNSPVHFQLYSTQ